MRQHPVRDSGCARVPAREPRRSRHSAAAILVCVAALLTSTSASAASGWWNPDWQYRKAITLQLPASDSGGLTSSIVLPIRLHSGNFNYFRDLQPNGADLRFIAADGTSLKYQLELLDPALGLLIAWVEVPVTAGASQSSIWMYYGLSADANHFACNEHPVGDVVRLLPPKHSALRASPLRSSALMRSLLTIVNTRSAEAGGLERT